MTSLKLVPSDLFTSSLFLLFLRQCIHNSHSWWRVMEFLTTRNHVDDYSADMISGSIDDVISKLESHSRTLTWSEYNYLKPNPGKWHFI